MDEYPKLPEHYVKRTIADMLPDDICYPDSETMIVDHKTLQPYFNRYTPISVNDKEPSRILGHYGLMRVLQDTPECSFDGYIVDMRYVKSDNIVQDDFTPSADDDYDTIQELEKDRKEFISPIGIIALDGATREIVLLGAPALHDELRYLAAFTDSIREKMNERTSRKSNRIIKPAAHSESTQNKPVKKD